MSLFAKAPRLTLVVFVLLSAVAWLLAGAATPAWIEGWAPNRETIAHSVQGIDELEQSADAFAATVDAAIANGTSDVELTKLLMNFLLELDDDPRFEGFVQSNAMNNSSSSSNSGGSLSTGDSAGAIDASSNAATRLYSDHMLALFLTALFGTVALVG